MSATTYSLLHIIQTLRRLGDVDPVTRRNVVRDEVDLVRDALRGPGGASLSTTGGST